MARDDQLAGRSRTLILAGGRIRAKRRQQGWSLDSLSRECKVSAGLLSQIERGKGNPAFNTMVQIAHALGCSVASLMAEDIERTDVVVRETERATIYDARVCNSSHEGEHESLIIRQDAMLQAILVTLPPGYDTSETPFSHRGEEFGFILEGEHQVLLNGEPHDLSAGDSISYSSVIPHSYKNVGKEHVRAIWVITPPSF